MPDILLIHGTGVRRVAYDKSLNIVRSQANKYLKGVKVHACLWGEAEGAKLRLAGGSVPTYDDPQASMSKQEAEEIEVVTWRMLREDPLFELRLLQNMPPNTKQEEEQSPVIETAGERSSQLVSDLNTPPEFNEILRNRELEDYWSEARQRFSDLGELESILIKANRDPREVSRALARGLVASLLDVAIANGHLGISSETRDRLVDLLIPKLGQLPLAPFDWISHILLGMVKKIGTYRARRERKALTDAAYPAAGDILLYQKDGTGIRQFIKQQMANVPGDVILFAHSLGGIAAVDLLAMEDWSAKVKGLVTIGSQAPFLYEIGALRSLRCDQYKRDKLPAHFPKRWLNFWDPNDFLSYSGQVVFGEAAVTDTMVKSKLPFPDSHSAYWDQEAVWRKIEGFFPWT